MHKTVNEEYEVVEILLHDCVKGTFITIKETAVATCAVIHVFPSLGRKAHLKTLSLIIQLSKG